MTDRGSSVWTVSRRPQAVDDLYEVWEYLAGHDEILADRWIDRIDESIARLAEYPMAGSGRPQLPEELRVWPVPPYLILYRLDQAAHNVDVLRIVDGRRDIGKLLAP